MKRKIIVFLIIGLMLLINVSVIFVSGLNTNKSSNNRITVEYFFETPKIKEINIGDTPYIDITLKDIPCIGNPGEPRLPVKGAYILLPQKTEVNKIIVTPKSKNSIQLNNLVRPVANSVKLSELDSATLPTPDKEIYTSPEPFPRKLFTSSETQSFRGYNILILNLYPVQYTPTENKIDFYDSFKVTINLENKEQINSIYRGLEKDKEAVIDIVDNPVETKSYVSSPQQSSDDDYDLLIITDKDFKNYFQRYADERQDGIRTIIKTTDKIDKTNFKRTKDIKNFIKNAYWNYGIEYVILGGDTDIIPVEYERCFNPSDSRYMDVATDQWYVNFGFDLIPELHIGRVCTSDFWEVTYFVNKSLDYINCNYDNYNKALMVGEYLGRGFYDDQLYGKDMMEELIDQCNNHDYTTNGIPSERYDIEKIYDKKSEWNKNSIKSKINNNNPSIINHLGHGNNFHIMKLDEPWIMRDGDILGDATDVTEGLNNKQTFFMYSQACYSGAFDNIDYTEEWWGVDCIAEYLTVKTDYGAHSGIFNTRYGWGSSAPDIAEGPSQHFHRLFWSEIFSKTSSGETKTIGEANTNSKISTLNYHEATKIHEYCYWELTLLGDPSVKLKGTAAPQTPNKLYGGITSGLIHHSYDFYAYADDIDEERISYGLDWDGDDIVDEWTELRDSGRRITVSNVWRDVGTFNVKVKARDEGGFVSDWSESLEVTIENDPNNPSPPEKPVVYNEGNGKRNEEYRFNVSTNEPDGDQVYYLCDFGDGEQSDWIGPKDADENIKIEHTWTKRGKYNVGVKAKDTHGAESDWTYFELDINNGKSKTLNKNPNLYQKILEQFPIILRFLELFKI